MRERFLVSTHVHFNTALVLGVERTGERSHTVLSTAYETDRIRTVPFSSCYTIKPGTVRVTHVTLVRTQIFKHTR